MKIKTSQKLISFTVGQLMIIAKMGNDMSGMTEVCKFTLNSFISCKGLSNQG